MLFRPMVRTTLSALQTHSKTERGEAIYCYCPDDLYNLRQIRKLGYGVSGRVGWNV